MRKNPVDENSLRKASALLARQWLAEAEKDMEPGTAQRLLHDRVTEDELRHVIHALNT